MPDISVGDVIEFLVTYKWWLFALIPFGLAVMVLRSRG